jgi:hypothetical protein
LAVLVVLLVTTVAAAQSALLPASLGPEYNKTANATCVRNDMFDEYIYHAPLVTGIVPDADGSDWDAYPALEWASPIYSAISEGQGPPPDSDEDYSCRFKLAWTYEEDWPCLLMIMEIIDDDQWWDPEGSWNTMDVVQFWYSEHMYDYDVPIPQAQMDEDYGYKTYRQMNVFGIPGWGIRMNACSHLDPPESYCLDEENQPLTLGDQTMEGNHVWMEARVQLFDSYENYTPWSVIPGESCLGLGFSGCNDYDGDESFSYMTWGQSYRDIQAEQIQNKHSTIAFEREYAVLFGPEAVEASTWGTIKTAF